MYKIRPAIVDSNQNSLLKTLQFRYVNVEGDLNFIRTYPIFSFHQEIISGRVPFPVDILRNTDSSIMQVNLESLRCCRALKPIIKWIFNKAIESCICIGGFYLLRKKMGQLGNRNAVQWILHHACFTKPAISLAIHAPWALFVSLAICGIALTLFSSFCEFSFLDRLLCPFLHICLISGSLSSFGV